MRAVPEIILQHAIPRDGATMAPALVRSTAPASGTRHAQTAAPLTGGGTLQNALQNADRPPKNRQ
jgi:hypothetical protein